MSASRTTLVWLHLHKKEKNNNLTMDLWKRRLVVDCCEVNHCFHFLGVAHVKLLGVGVVQSQKVDVEALLQITSHFGGIH